MMNKLLLVSFIFVWIINDCASSQFYIRDKSSSNSNNKLAKLILKNIENDLIEQELTDKYFSNSKRDNDENSNEDNSKINDYKNAQSYGDGIHITMNGEKVDICDEEYVQIVEKLHPKLKNVLISACTGSSSAKWVIQKVAKYIFKKDL